MMNDKIQSAFNKHLIAEFESGYLYLSMAAYFESINMQGMAKWMHVQVQEEVGHAMKFFGHIQERGGKVVLGSVDAPKIEWKSPMDAFADAHKHECKISRQIDKMVDLTIELKDHASNAFLQWFVSEQVEEEDTVKGIVERMRLAGDHAGALFILDHELGARIPAGDASTA